MRSRVTRLAYLVAIAFAMVGWTCLIFMSITWALGL
jgi:hypothetical protein